MIPALGYPRLHLRSTDSTNERARALALAGAPHGTLVTAAEQTAGHGRQGRTWWAPPGSALLMSVVMHEPPGLLGLIAAVAVCDAVTGAGGVGRMARVKWPNDIVLPRPPAPPAARPPAPPAARPPTLSKLAGILVEGRPQEGWAVLGIGVNVAMHVEQLPDELRATAASLELAPSEIEPLLGELLDALHRRLGEPAEAVLDAWRARDALYGQEIAWQQSLPTGGRRQWQSGQAAGIDGEGRLLVRLDSGAQTALSAGEVHLRSPAD